LGLWTLVLVHGPVWGGDATPDLKQRQAAIENAQEVLRACEAVLSRLNLDLFPNKVSLQRAALEFRSAHQWAKGEEKRLQEQEAWVRLDGIVSKRLKEAAERVQSQDPGAFLESVDSFLSAYGFLYEVTHQKKLNEEAARRYSLPHWVEYEPHSTPVLSSADLLGEINLRKLFDEVRAHLERLVREWSRDQVHLKLYSRAVGLWGRLLSMDQRIQPAALLEVMLRKSIPSYPRAFELAALESRLDSTDVQRLIMKVLVEASPSKLKEGSQAMDTFQEALRLLTLARENPSFVAFVRSGLNGNLESLGYEFGSVPDLIPYLRKIYDDWEASVARENLRENRPVPDLVDDLKVPWTQGMGILEQPFPSDLEEFSEFIVALDRVLLKVEAIPSRLSGSDLDDEMMELDRAWVNVDLVLPLNTVNELKRIRSLLGVWMERVPQGHTQTRLNTLASRFDPLFGRLIHHWSVEFEY